MKRKLLSIVSAFLVCLSFSLVQRARAAHFEGVTRTSTWITFIGNITIHGQAGSIGDEIGVFDQELLVGRFQIAKEGQYGTLYVFGDDTYTDGATSNSLLTFKLWQASIQSETILPENRMYTGTLGQNYVESPIPPLWTGNNGMYVLNFSDPPVADAGPDQTLEEGGIITLNGSGSTDLNNDISSYFWTQTGGPPVSLTVSGVSNPSFLTPKVNAGESISLIFQLMVKDEKGLQSSDEVTVMVNDNGITDLPDEVITEGITTRTFSHKSIGLKVQKRSDAGPGENITGNITKLHALDPDTILDNAHKPDNLIYGLIDLQIKVPAPGDNVAVTVYLPEPAPEGYNWYKYSQAIGWLDYSEHAQFNEERNQITFILIDGGAGDDDGEANGVINDPSGLGYIASIPGGGGNGDNNDNNDHNDNSGNSGGGGGGCFIREIQGKGFHCF